MGYKLSVQGTYTEITFDEPADLNTLIQVNEHRNEHLRVLIDLSPGLAIDFSGLHDLLVELNERCLPEGATTAIYVQDNLDYGYSKVFEDYRTNLGLTVSVFRDKDEAIAWLE
tara:strand:- start:944 stop:1282 length:339 start_codon:yes stop_codon:yes gene_type:complete